MVGVILRPSELVKHPAKAERLAAGCVPLGGPQAGLISGREDLVKKMRSNSLFRALRVDKLIYAALEATLLAYLRQDHDAIPAVRMMRLSASAIAERAAAIAKEVRSSKVSAQVVDGESLIGGGAAPSAVLPTRLLAITGESLSTDELAARLRRSDPPIVARVEGDRVVLDLRTVFPEQDRFITAALNAFGS